MNLKFTLLIAAMLSLSAAAQEAKTIVLNDGSTASVLSQKGTTTTYIKEAKAGADGKIQLVQDEVFDGERLVRKSDGKCFTLREHLVTLETVTVGEIKIQRPKTTRESKAASCIS